MSTRTPKRLHKGPKRSPEKAPPKPAQNKRVNGNAHFERTKPVWQGGA